MSNHPETGRAITLAVAATASWVFCFPSSLWSQELPTGEVKLPLAQYDKLNIELANSRLVGKSNSLPPLGFVLSSANLKIQTKGSQVLVHGILQVENLQTESWETIRLLPAGTSVISAGPKEATFAMVEKQFSLVTKQSGKQFVELGWVKEAAGLLDGAGVEIPIPAAGVVTFQLELDPARQTVVEGAIRLDEGKYVTIPGQPVRLRRLPDPAVRKAATPSVWTATRELACSFDENDLTLQCRVTLRLKEGEGWEAKLLLPSAYRVGTITSSDLIGSRVERLNDQTNVLTLDWLAGGAPQRDILLTLKTSLPTEGSAWKIAPPLLEAESGPLVWYAFDVPDDLDAELTGVDVQNKTPGTWLQRGAQNTRSRFVLGNPSVSLRLKPAEVLESPRVSADLATAQSRVVKDGAIATELTYQLKHDPGASVSFELPKGAQFLGCRVGDAPVSPLREGEQTIRIRLPKQASASKVSFSIYQKSEPWNPLRGSCHLRLPKAEMMVQRIDWSLVLPEDYEIEAFEGNVSAVTGQTSSFRKELCNAETPMLDLFYQERGPGK